MQQILSEKHHISGNHYIALRIMKDPKKQREYLTIFRVGFCRHWISSSTKYLLRLLVGNQPVYRFFGSKFPKTKSAVNWRWNHLEHWFVYQELGCFLWLPPEKYLWNFRIISCKHRGEKLLNKYCSINFHHLEVFWIEGTWAPNATASGYSRPY